MVIYGYICTLSDTFYFVLAQIASGSSMSARGPLKTIKSYTRVFVGTRDQSLPLKLLRSPARRLLITYM